MIIFMTHRSISRVMIKISGEALASTCPIKEGKSYGICQDMLHKIANDIQSLYEMNIGITIVVGGGNIYRGVHGVTKHNMNRTTSDHMGMLATVINGLALHNAIQCIGLPCRLMTAIPMDTVAQPFTRGRAIRNLEKGRIVIFAAGTGNPYFTTDTAAALRAAEMSCDLLLKATKVHGVYDKDPMKHKDAKLFREISYDEVIENKLKVMDATALTLAHENNLPIRVFSIYAENCFANVIKELGEFTKIF